jgi:hypothetical protein
MIFPFIIIFALSEFIPTKAKTLVYFSDIFKLYLFAMLLNLYTAVCRYNICISYITLTLKFKSNFCFENGSLYKQLVYTMLHVMLHLMKYKEKIIYHYTVLHLYTLQQQV